MKKLTSLTNPSMQELLFPHRSSPLPHIRAVYTPHTLKMLLEPHLLTVVMMRGPTGAPGTYSIGMRGSTFSFESMRAFYNIAGSICCGSADHSVVVAGGRVSELVSSRQSLFTPPPPQMLSRMCIIIKAGIRSEDFTVLKLFYLSFAVRLWSTEASAPSVCRATEDISGFRQNGQTTELTLTLL